MTLGLNLVARCSRLLDWKGSGLLTIEGEGKDCDQRDRTKPEDSKLKDRELSRENRRKDIVINSIKGRTEIYKKKSRDLATID